MKRFLYVASTLVTLVGCQTTPTCPPRVQQELSELHAEYHALQHTKAEYAQLEHEHTQYADALWGFEEHKGTRTVHTFAAGLYRIGQERVTGLAEDISERKERLRSHHPNCAIVTTN